MRTLIIGIGISVFVASGISLDNPVSPYRTSDNPLLEHPTPEETVDGYKIGESIGTGNLQVFLIEGNEELQDRKYVTLSEAMDKKMVKVNETGSVNQLSIDNNSDQTIFIHSGDIVKGGKQDRTLSHDVIIPPKTKNVALQSFCVEQGRWSQRSGEALHKFGSNTKMLSSKKLKMAAKYDRDQGAVWKNVADEQVKLEQNVSRLNGYALEIRGARSETSLQLTLESEELKKAKKQLTNEFENVLVDNPESIGYAYAINGEVYGVDIYNNKELFKDLWPKISESIITESISELDTAIQTRATKGDVVAFMKGSGEADELSEKPLNEATDLEIKENRKGDVVFSTIDKKKSRWVHKNYMKKESSKK